MRIEELRPSAKWFVDKLLQRVQRIVKGEDVGELVDSDLENLEEDDLFENRRMQMELATSHEWVLASIMEESQGQYSKSIDHNEKDSGVKPVSDLQPNSPSQEPLQLHPQTPKTSKRSTSSMKRNEEKIQKALFLSPVGPESGFNLSSAEADGHSGALRSGDNVSQEEMELRKAKTQVLGSGKKTGTLNNGDTQVEFQNTRELEKSEN